jgi:hypothetical protein
VRFADNHAYRIVKNLQIGLTGGAGRCCLHQGTAAPATDSEELRGFHTLNFSSNSLGDVPSTAIMSFTARTLRASKGVK